MGRANAAGRGWIALALVVFSGWRAGRLLAGAYFFGVLMTLELYAKASGFFPALSVLGGDALHCGCRRAGDHVGRDVAGSEAPACLAGRLYRTVEVKEFTRRRMSMITRRNLMKTAAAGLTLPA